MDQFRQVFPECHPDNPRYGFNTGFMTGMLEFGAFLGCVTFPFICDKISRKWGLSVAVFIFCVGAAIQTAASDYATLVAGRTVGGIGVGALAMGAPLYISEIAPPRLRGAFLVLEFLAIVIGAVAAYWITYGTRVIPSDWAFRLPFLLQVVPALSVGLGIHLFPFSPRWLAMVGRNEQCLITLARIRGSTVEDSEIVEEYQGILVEVKLQKLSLAREHPKIKNSVLLEAVQWVDLFRPKYLKRTAAAFGVNFFQQFSGITAFVYYAPNFFRELGQSDDMSLILAGMVNICQTLGGVAVFMYLDKAGRRPLLIWGALAMATPHIIMAGIVGKFGDSWESNPGMGWFGVALIYIYILCYAVSYGPIAWALPAEVFAISKRAKGVGAAAAVNWISNFVIGVVVPEMLIKIGWGTYLFFGVMCLLASVFAFFFIPETANKSLEEISLVFKDNLAEEDAEIGRVTTS